MAEAGMAHCVCWRRAAQGTRVRVVKSIQVNMTIHCVVEPPEGADESTHFATAWLPKSYLDEEKENSEL